MLDSRAWFSATRPVVRYTSGYRSTSVGLGATLWPPMGTRLIDSVPPATTTEADPHMMRSAANAIAWRPDEQKRLMVTADALTGMPALRLAMRATFRPCSASGIAHPRITSSISPASIPGARLSASAMAVAARASGRVPRRTPCGALPVGVRTAETSTASCMTPSLSQQIFDRVRDLSGSSIEEMIRAVDDDELFRLGRTRVELPQILQRADLVALAVDEVLRLAAAADEAEVEARRRRRNPDQRRHAGIRGAGREGDPGAERHAGRPERSLGVLRPHEVERRPE